MTGSQTARYLMDLGRRLRAADGRLRALTVSARRGHGARLKYAGLTDVPNVGATRRGIAIRAEQTPDGGTLYVIPTATAMLEVRNILGRWAAGAFWQRDNT
jgi:hypothetical protein